MPSCQELDEKITLLTHFYNSLDALLNVRRGPAGGLAYLSTKKIEVEALVNRFGQSCFPRFPVFMLSYASYLPYHITLGKKENKHFKGLKA